MLNNLLIPTGGRGGGVAAGGGGSGGGGGGGGGGGPGLYTFAGALVYKSTNQTANFNHTFISWDSEQYDTAGFHDNASNNSRLTVPAAHDGDYVVLRATFQITALQNAGNLGAYFRKNGNIFDGLGNELFIESDITVGYVQVTSQPVPVVTGDYFEAVLFTDDTATTLVAATSSFGIEVVS